MKNKQLTCGALLSYAAIAFNIISGLLYTPWMIRTIGSDQYALYTLALSIVTLFLLDFGIGGAISKFLSNYYAKGEYNAANRFMGIVYKVFILISAVIALCLGIFFFLIDGIYVKLTPAELVVFKRLFVIVGVHSVLTFPFTSFNGVLMANEQFIAVKACNLGQKVLTVLLIVVALFLGSSVYVLVLATAVSNILFLIIKYICIKRKTQLRTSFACRDRNLVKSLCSFSVWITVVNLAQRLIFNIMPSIIAATIGSIQVTVFSIAATLEGYVFTFADAINGMFLPKISRILVGERPEEQLSDLMAKVGRFHVCTIGLLFVGFLCVGRQFISLWMGPGYEKVYLCALLLIFPSLIDVPQQVARTALLAKDIVKQQAAIYVVMACTNIVLSLILIPSLGIVGAAVSICTAYLLRTVAFNILYRKKLFIDLKKYFSATYCRWILVAVATTLAGFCITRFLPLPGWLGLAVHIGILVCIYAVLFLFLGLRKIERRQILSFSRIRRNRNVSE